MASSSSAQKVAKLATRGKGKKVRFQGGTTFPVIVAVVGALLIGLIAYAKASLPDDGGGPPRLGDHWHAAYSFYACQDDGSYLTLPNLKGNLEERGVDSVTGEEVLTNKAFSNTGIHSHEDGVIHWHPYTSRATGQRAKLGVFLDNYDVELTDTKLALPAEQGGEVFDTATYKCDGKDTVIKVRIWDNYASDTFRDCVTDCTDTRVSKNGMVFVVAVVPAEGDVEIPKPAWAADLPSLGAADGGDPIPSSGSTPGGTVPLVSVPGGSTPGTTAATPGTGAATPGTTAATTPVSTASSSG